MDVQIVKGPPVSKVSKVEAETQLQRHPAFPKGASYTLDEVEGRWIAAFATTKQAAPPFAPSEEGPPSGPPSGPPGPEGLDGPPAPEESGPLSDEGKPPSDEGKPGEKKPGKGGEQAAIQHLTQLVETLVNALGLGGPEGSPVPGPDDIPPPPHPGGPPVAPAGPGSDDKQHVVHERSLKPGEAAPGSTPVGAPSFASVREDHPWREVVGKVRTFRLSEAISEEDSMAAIANELHTLANEVGYRIEQLHESRDESGHRIAKALVVR